MDMLAFSPSRRSVLGAIGLSGGLTGCLSEFGREIPYRFCMDVWAFGRMHHGRVVQGFRYRPRKGALDGGELRVRGEAMLLELAPLRYLVATFAAWGVTLTDEGLRPYMWKAQWTPGQARVEEGMTDTHIVRGGLAVDMMTHLRERGPMAFALNELPVLVTFDDPSDSRTVRVLDPADLAPVFGPGARIDRAWVEATYALKTHGVLAKALPWADTPNESRFFSGESIGMGNDPRYYLSNQDLIRK